MSIILTRRSWIGYCALSSVLPGQEMDIFAAAAAGDTRRVTGLLNETPALANAVDSSGFRPLNHAARNGKAEIVMILSSRGADLNAGKPLLDACGFADSAVAMEMVATLAGNNAEVNIAAPDGRTPLHIAAEKGHELACWMLIHRGAKADARDASGKTPADLATGAAADVLRRSGSIARVYFGARFGSDRQGKKPGSKHPSGAPQDAVNRFVIASHGNTPEAKNVLAEHPEVLVASATFDELAVEAAAHVGNIEWCTELVDRQSPYSVCTAVVLGDIEGVKQMIRQDTNRLRECGPHDQALLCYTAFDKPQLEIAEFLLASGADVNSRGLGHTTLHFAARRGYLELARLLLEKGADVRARSWSRMAPGTALDLARRSGKPEMIALLESRNER